MRIETAEKREARLERMRVYGRAWHERVKETRNKKIREQYAKDKEGRSIKAAKRYLKSRDKILLQSAEYYRNNKEKVSLRTRARNATLRALGDVDKTHIEFLFKAQRGRCAACEKKLAGFHIDHKQPIIKGGTNERHNLQLLCPNCNLRKATKSMEEFMRRLGKLL